MMSKSILQKHYSRILSQWPEDLLRPHLRFQNSILQRRRDRIVEKTQESQEKQGQQGRAQTLGKAKTMPPPSSSSTVPATATATASAFIATATTERGTGMESGTEADELQQINTLYSLLENRYLKKYPLSPSTLTPLSNPTYYNDLLKELDAAPHRSRWEAWLNRWKGFLRFK